MTRRVHPNSLTSLALICAALIAPSAALAATGPGTGGAGLGGAGAPGSASGAATPNPLVTPANTTITATGNGITVQTAESGLLSRRYRFTGTVPAADAGDVVEIERSAPSQSGSWAATAHATVTSTGSFTVVWRANQSGRFSVEAVLLSATTAFAASRTSMAAAASTSSTGSGAASVAGPAGPASPALEITVYRPSVATFYGPGFWGRRTACGQTLHRFTLGVASRTLTCGTKVSVMYRGRAIVVPVIDRGPYSNGANWDLTWATARALGITGTVTVGALPTS